MKCPFCSAQETQVIDSRVSEEGDVVRRRRRCTVCHKRFTTYETAELRMPTIVKSNGQREDFSRGKVDVTQMEVSYTTSANHFNYFSCGMGEAST